MHKPESFWRLCQTNEKYFMAWEEGRGPGQVNGQREVPQPASRVTQKPKSPPWELQSRVATCMACEAYMGKERCKEMELGCGNVFRKKLMRAENGCPRKLWTPQKAKFVTCADLAAASVKLLSLLPKDISRVVGIPRSGMAPAAILASMLHRPLFSLTLNGELVPVGGGHRAGWGEMRESGGIPVYVDDTTHNGNTIRKYKQNGVDFSDGVIAVCFALSKDEINYWAEDLPTPHLLEWNIGNAPWAQHLGLDLDGIVCHNPPWQARPHYPFRAVSVRAIITARPEDERPETEQWLNEWGMKYGELIMWGGSESDRWVPSLVGKWKAEHCIRLGVEAYVESEPDLADVMRGYGVRVLCPRQGFLC